MSDHSSILLFTGCISGILSRTLVAPLETLRVLQQTNQAPYSTMTINKGLSHLVKNRGFTSMYRGNGWNLFIIGPFSALEFFFYDVYNNNLFQGRRKQDLTIYEKLLCGGLTGMTAMLFIYPLEVLKTRATVAEIKLPKFTVRTMYQGLGISLLGIVPLIGVRQSLFDALTQSSPNLASPSLNCLYGAISGLSAISVVYPIELLKRNMQIKKVKIWSLTQNIYNE